MKETMTYIPEVAPFRGNNTVYNILNQVTTTLYLVGISDYELDSYKMEATSADYEHCIYCSHRWLSKYGCI